jgi:hypothetical protein
MAKRTMTVTLEKCIQDSQDYGSDDEHMVSRVFFRLELDGKVRQTYADIKQAVGSDYESGPLEVGRPHDYRGPLDYERFRDEVTAYYRSLVGSTGSAIRISGGAKVRMRNNFYGKTRVFVMDAEDTGGGW